ncbi:MAG: response regulator, partial [Bryobacteraceae bacterium]
MTVRVLLAESDPENVLFLRDVLADIEAGGDWGGWVHFETLHAATLDEALAVLANEAIEAILLDSGFEGRQGIEIFRRIQAAAPEVPMIVFVRDDEIALGMRAVREGAQDYLVSKQADSAPLAHALRNAIERQRLRSALQARSSTDSLTGLPNRGAFLTSADRERILAERLGRRMMIVIAEPLNLAEMELAFGCERRDLALIEAADHLRSLAGPADLVARIEDHHFGIAVFETPAEPLEQSWARLHT